MALQRPQLWWQVAFNADPNDPDAIPLWSDLTVKMRKLQRYARGRPYELGKPVAASPQITWRDPDEDLNPANTDSPYWPDVEPYRELLAQAMWPNGGTGNLINSKRWRGNNEVAPDPGFESSADGAALPGWVSAVGGTVPTVTSVNPQEGLRSLTYTVAGTTTPQGVSWQADCVPGEQYTASVYVRQTSASPQWLTVGDQTVGFDRFRRVVAAGSWQADELGQTWLFDGTPANFFVDGTAGVIQMPSGVVDAQSAYLPGVVVNPTIRCRMAVKETSTGGSQFGYVRFNQADVSNYDRLQLTYSTDGKVDALLAKVVADVATTLDSVSDLLDYTPGQLINVLVDVDGPALRAKVWAGDAIPETWTLEADNATYLSGQVGVRATISGSNTNTNPTLYFDDFTAVGATASATTTTTGAYTRLQHTFVASQPKHTISVVTTGTAVAGTVNVDAIQHEPGAAASAYTADGPVIYPVGRLNVERWPREYEAAGFVGKSVTPAVDGLAALAAIRLAPEYVMAAAELAPDFWWRLNDGIDTVSALDRSGNNGAPLVRSSNPQGAGTDVRFESAIAIPGEPGALGVLFTPPTGNPGDPFAGGTGLAAGKAAGFLSKWGLFPDGTLPAGQWAASVAVWVNVVNPGQPWDNSILRIYTYQAADAEYREFVKLFYTTLGGQPWLVTGSRTLGVGALGPVGIDDGQAHLLVGVVTQVDGGNTTATLYVDGQQVASNSATTAATGGYYPLAPNTIRVGISDDGAGFQGMADGVFSNLKVWTRALSAGEVGSLWQAGGVAGAGELTGTRISRHFVAGGYTKPSRISAGSTRMQPPTWTGSLDALTDAINTTVVEDGTLWAAPDGHAVFEGRQDRWLRTASVATFGEDTANGEIPYQDGLRFDYDPLFVYADVQVSRLNGSTALGGMKPDRDATARRYFPRPYRDSGDYETDTLAQSKADWVFASHKAPLQRVSAITIDPSSNPALWHAALSLEVGQRVTVKRRAKAANAGAGVIMSADYLIEQVIHNEIDMQSGRWTISFLLSPIGVVPGVTLQPWILGDTTYSVLGTSTILGW